jgi:hypothetical protein
MNSAFFFYGQTLRIEKNAVDSGFKRMENAAPVQIASGVKKRGFRKGLGRE